MPLAFKNVGIYMGRYAFKSKASGIELDYSTEEKDVTNLGSAVTEMIPGVMKVGAKIEGYVDYGDISSTSAEDVYSEPILYSWLTATTGVPITVCRPGSEAEGATAFMFQGQGYQAAPIAGSMGEVQKFSCRFAPSAGPLVRGKIGLAKGTYSGASGNGGALQLGLLPAGSRIWIAVHVFAVTGAVSVVFKLQSDDAAPFTTPQDRITLTAATQRTEIVSSLTGPVATDTYWRVQYARTGGTSFNAAAFIGISPY